MTANSSPSFRLIVSSFFSLILVLILWELYLAPLKPGGSWLVLKILPLLCAAKGIVKRDNYTMQWASMLVLLYFTEGVVRAFSDIGLLSRILALTELGLSLFLFCALLSYLRPIKKAAKAAKATSNVHD